MEIAGYQLLEPLAESGTATVYLARHDHAVERQYIIKVLKKAFAADAEIAKSFLEQARSAQEIQHPGFVAIYDYGEHDGAPYYVMDYIPGESLEHKRYAMCLLDKIYVIKQAARILEYIAKFHRVHGNINPANIFLHEFDSRVVLTDCGFTQDASYRILHPDSAYALMTGAYVSPEQANFSTTDPRSDIYSLGVVFYTLLVGTPPFDASTSAGLNAQQVSEEPPNLPQAKRVFQPIITKALAKAPADRFQCASELVFALEQISDEDILLAEGIELAAAQEPASEPVVVPFARKRQVSAADRRAAGELAQVLKQPITPVQTKTGHETKHAAPKRKSGAVSNPAAKPATVQDTPGRHARKDISNPLRVGVAPLQITRRSGKTRGRRSARGVALALVLASGLGIYGVQNQAQLAGVYKNKLAPALPPSVVTWLAHAADNVRGLNSEASEYIIAFLHALERANIGDDMKTPDLPATHTDDKGGDWTSAKVVPDKVELQEPPGIGDQAQVLTPELRLKVVELLAQAKTKVESNHLVTPAEQSAYGYYQQVLALDEHNLAARLGVADIAAQQHSLALEQREMGNFEAAVELAKSSAQLLPGEAKDVLIKQLEQHVVVQQRQLEENITKLLSYAEGKVYAGYALHPASDNAVIAYRRVLELDPENTLALGALETIKVQALQRVREKLDSGALDSADALITRIGVFFRVARPELEVLSTRLIQLRSPPVQEKARVLTQAFLETQQ